MSDITTRTGKGTPLTHAELDANFTNLNADKAGHPTGEGEGGAVAQATSKSTGVTLSKKCGQITMHNASLAANGLVSFTLTNTEIAATDVLVLNHSGGGTIGHYAFSARCASGSATIAVRNVHSAALTDAVVIGFVLIKAATD